MRNPPFPLAQVKNITTISYTDFFTQHLLPAIPAVLRGAEATQQAGFLESLTSSEQSMLQSCEAVGCSMVRFESADISHPQSAHWPSFPFHESNSTIQDADTYTHTKWINQDLVEAEIVEKFHVPFIASNDYLQRTPKG